MFSYSYRPTSKVNPLYALPMSFRRMTEERRWDGKHLFPSVRVPFKGGLEISTEALRQTVHFAYRMINEGHHRVHRTGGTHKRKKSEIFLNTLTGKIAEAVVHDVLRTAGYDVSDPDYSVSGVNVWDSGDLTVKLANGKVIRISVKATKSYSQFMFLEHNDWGIYGEYLPACRDTRRKAELVQKASNGYGHLVADRLTEEEREEIGLYDIHVLVRINSKFYEGMENVFRAYGENVGEDVLMRTAESLYCGCEISGFIRNDELVRVIREGFIIYKDEYLKERTRMDATNYYVHIGDMHPLIRN